MPHSLQSDDESHVGGDFFMNFSASARTILDDARCHRHLSTLLPLALTNLSPSVIRSTLRLLINVHLVTRTNRVLGFINGHKFLSLMEAAAA